MGGWGVAGRQWRSIAARAAHLSALIADRALAVGANFRLLHGALVGLVEVPVGSGLDVVERASRGAGGGCRRGRGIRDPGGGARSRRVGSPHARPK